MLGNLQLAAILQFLYQNRAQELAYWMRIFMDQVYRGYLDYPVNQSHRMMGSHLSQSNIIVFN